MTRRHVETSSYAAMMRRMVAAHIRRVIAGDVEDLAELVALHRQLEEGIREAIAKGRGDQPGYAWSYERIGAMLGITRQSAWERFDPNAARLRDRRKSAAAERRKSAAAERRKVSAVQRELAR